MNHSNDMSEETEHLKKHIKLHVVIGLSLAMLSLLTVGVALLPFSTAGHMVVGLVICFIMAGLVAYFFMHLSAERKFIYQVTGFTVFFCIGLLLLTLLAYWDYAGNVFNH